MIWSLLRLRVHQGWRYVLELGAIRALVLLAFLLFGWLNLLRAMIFEPLYAPTFLAVALFIALGIHFQRKDERFLRLIHTNPQWLCAAEYITLSLPWLVLASLSAYWFLVPACILILFAITFLPFPKSGNLFKDSAFHLPFIAKNVFEWRGGLRKELPQVLVLIAVGFGFLYVPWIFPLVMLFMGILAASFYFECEPLMMLNVEDKPYQLFLWGKVKEAIINYSFMMFLPMSIYFLLNISYWFLPIYAWFIVCLILMFAIFLKYALYEPSSDLRFNGFFLGLMIISFLLPFLFPIPFIMMIRYYRKATNNLKDILGY